MKKIKLLLTFLLFALACGTVQAQMVRCVDPSTKRITLSQGICPPGMRAEAIASNNNTGIQPGTYDRNAARSSTSSSGSANSRISTVRSCKRTCPRNSSICLEWY